MRILFNGCSYTYGFELENRLQDRFSRLVANHYNAEEFNISWSGRSNDAICRTTMDWFAAGHTCDIAVIQWSVLARIEGYDEKDNHKDQNNYVHVTLQTPKNWGDYYADFYHAQLGIDTLFKNQYILEQFFIQRNIKYIFLMHDCWFDYVFDLDSVWKKFLVEKDYHIIRGGEEHQDKVILTNPRINNIHFETKHGHPSVAGHRALADYIINRIQ